MSDRSEADLVRVLAGAAGNAPEPAGDLLEVVRRRRARRARRRTGAVLAAAAVIAVVAGGTAVARGVFSHRGGEGPALVDATVTASPGRPTPSPRASGPAAPLEVRPAAEVWPAAVSTIPAKAPDGWRYRPVTALSATELLLAAESSFEKAGRLEVYDTAGGSRRVLADMPGPPGAKGYFPQRVEAGAENIVWYGTNPSGGAAWADFWVVPRSGGTARRIGEVTGAPAEVDGIGVTADSVVWSVRAGGVYRMPLAGGAPERIEGADGLHLLSWPWAADVGERDFQKAQGKLVNLETGQVTEVKAAEGTTTFRCGPQWCFGEGDGTGAKAFAERVDGSRRSVLPGLSALGGRLLLARDFGMFHVSGVVGRDERGEEIEDRTAPVAALYDPAAGTLAGIGNGDGQGGGGYGWGTSSSPSAIVYWDADVKNVERCRTADGKAVPRPSGTAGRTDESVICEAIPQGGGKELTVVNLLAVPKTE
ncbi:hypothetical protein ACFOWE_32620 [Planomonospora corallina]|uniref:Uncharacterized protein n=1 Tax=Planomonospora corallina TaxID=1806052 RepID=A0ABV8IFM7_9ACTN